MAGKEKKSKQFMGLLGKNISYSFSRGYFTEKFRNEGLLDHEYVNFDIQSINEFPKVIHQFKHHLKGLNVTIPYKQDISSYLDYVHEVAKEVGAVNTIGITEKRKLKGYNTDVIGFENSLKPLLKKRHKRALILGTGGASKAVAYVLNNLGIKYLKVSRHPKKKEEISYSALNKQLFTTCTIIVNCTPLGTFPRVALKPNIPYKYLNESHLLYDLIYNPQITSFLKEGKERGSQIKNGLEMLELQAEASWRIWNPQ